MDVIVRKQYKTINPFELRDLPDLVVLTGENGMGELYPRGGFRETSIF